MRKPRCVRSPLVSVALCLTVWFAGADADAGVTRQGEGDGGVAGCTTSEPLRLAFLDSGVLHEEVRPFLLEGVEDILTRAGISVLQFWEPREWRPAWGHLLRVVITDKDPLTFGVSRDALGAIRGTEFPRSVAFIFYPRVLQEIDAASVRGSRRRSAEIGRSVAVIVAHEVLHALAPDHEHSVKGVMDRELGREELLQPRAALAAEDAEALCRGLIALGSSR